MTLARSRWLLLEQALVLLAAIVPLALAEPAWWYLILAVLAVGTGWWRAAHQKKPLLNAGTSRMFVMGAFGLLLLEYWYAVIPVMALSHFMVLVCASKFLQERTLRDDAQLAVLCLLLLVVAAIVSGNVVFLLVLIAYLSIGLDVLIRFNASLERARVQRVNQSICPTAASAANSTETVRGAVGATLVMSLVGLAVGIAVFVFFPRIGGGMFGRPDIRGAGPAVTGYSSSIDFDIVGPIAESERQIMRVVIESPDGMAPTENDALYLRGRTFDYYAGRDPAGRSWEWQRYYVRPFLDVHEVGGPEEGEIPLLPEEGPLADAPMVVQRYTFEQGAVNDSVLFSLYPAVAVSGITFDQVELLAKSLEDQTLEQRLRSWRPSHRLMRYTIRSVAEQSDRGLRAVEAERITKGIDKPQLHTPSPKLPDEAAILARINERIPEHAALDEPENRALFVAKVVEWLESGEFTYTLNPPAPASGTEHIGDFLLRSKRGCCQHFASAMTVICQLSGVPARIVTGFRCDSFNKLGGFWSVRGKHAHAWVEVYLPDVGWKRYDPTPVGAAGAAHSNAWVQKLRGCADYLQFEWVNFVIAYDADVRRDLVKSFETWLLRPARSESTIVGMVAAFVYELFAWRMQMSWQDRLLYWGFALLIVMLAVLIGYVIMVLCWRGWAWTGQRRAARRAASGRAADVLFYQQLCRRLSALGFRRRPEQTPAEFIADLAARHPILSPAAELVNAYYQIIYGGLELAPQRRSEFEGFLQQLNSLDRAEFRGP